MLARSQCSAFQCCPSLTQLAVYHLVPDGVSTHQWAARAWRNWRVMFACLVRMWRLHKKLGGGRQVMRTNPRVKNSPWCRANSWSSVMSKNLYVAIFAITTFLTPLHFSYAQAEESPRSKRLSLDTLNTCKFSTVPCKKEDLLTEHLDELGEA